MLEEIARRLDLNTHSGDRNAGLLLDVAPQAARESITCRSAPIFPACCAAATSFSSTCKKRLGIGNKEDSETGIFSLEEVECMGACTGAPAMQVNYDFYENLDADKVDAILEQLQNGQKPARSPSISGASTSACPRKSRSSASASACRNSRKIDVYLQTRRLSGARKSPEADDARPDHRRSEEIRACAAAAARASPPA